MYNVRIDIESSLAFEICRGRIVSFHCVFIYPQSKYKHIKDRMVWASPSNLHINLCPMYQETNSSSL